MKLLTEMASFNYFTILSYFLSFFGFVFWCFLPASIRWPYPISVITEDLSLYRIFSEFLSYPVIWLFFLLSASIAVIPDVIVKIFENMIFERQQRRREEKLALLKNKCMDVPRNFKEQQRKRKGEFDIKQKIRVSSCFAL